MKKKLFSMMGCALLATVALCTVGGMNTAFAAETVFVESEFAPLKRVVLTQTEVVLGKNILKYVDANAKVPEVTDENMKAWALERENLKEVLEKYGVEVQRPRLLTDYEKMLGNVENGYTEAAGVTNFFARDPFITIGNHIIECSLFSLYRRLEVLPIRPILQKEAEKSGCYYVSIPQADISEGNDSTVGPFLEGGDVLVYKKTVFVGNSGRATNHAGVVWLRNYLKHFGYNVVEVKMDKDILHLDCILSFPRDGLMIVCEEAMPEGLPTELKSWDKITVSKDEAQALATNGLPIDDHTYITDIAFKDTVGKELEKRGIKVEYIDYKLSRFAGGAFRCSTQPLLRK